MAKKYEKTPEGCIERASDKIIAALEDLDLDLVSIGERVKNVYVFIHRDNDDEPMRTDITVEEFDTSYPDD